MGNKKSKKGMIIDVQPLKTKKEINDMIEALEMSEFGQRNQLFFKMGISTGLRCSDLVKLRVDQVKGKSSLKVNEDKTEKMRVVYLNQVMADIADYIETLPEDAVYLFESKRSKKPISVTQAYRILKTAGDLIGNHSIGTHTMRKTFGYTYYQATKDIVTLMMIFNHSSQKITTRYIGVTEETIENNLKSISFF